MSDKTTYASPEEMVLAHRYRRWLLYCLCTYTTPMYLPDIAQQLAVWDRPDDETEFIQIRLAVYNDLYYDHLPGLRDANLVTYHQQHDEIDVGSATADIKPVLRDQLAIEIDDLLAAEVDSINTDGRMMDADDK